MNYRHWDHYVEQISHAFVADVTENGIANVVDILEGEPYECPLAPFGGIEQLDWSIDSKLVAYTCRKKEGVDYAISTDADIYIYKYSVYLLGYPRYKILSHHPEENEAEIAK